MRNLTMITGSSLVFCRLLYSKVDIYQTMFDISFNETKIMYEMEDILINVSFFL